MLGDVLYVFGGRNSSGLLTSVMALDLTTKGRWRHLPDLSDPRSGLSAVPHPSKGLIYVIGGVDWEGNVLATVDLYFPGNHSWARGVDLPTGRQYFGAALVGESLYVFGGWNAQVGTLSSLDVFNTRTQLWTTGPKMLEPAAAFATGSDGAHVYCFGGYDYRKPSFLATVQALDVATAQWKLLPPMPTPRANLAAARTGDQIHVMGGQNGTVLSIIESIDLKTNRWLRFPASLNPPREFFSALSSSSSLLVAGGQNGPFLSSVQSIDVLLCP